MDRRSGAAEVPAGEQPLRGELLSNELLKQFARNLAQNRRVENGNGPNRLLPRLMANEIVLRRYNERTLEVEKKRHITPAAEWLLDNFHLIEEQIRTVQRHLPRGFNRELPQLIDGPWASYPRVYEIALEIVAHTDGRIDDFHLTSFVAGYQEVVLLKLGELWAIPIMLRLALIENLRRVAVQLDVVRKDRDAAEHWAGRVLQVAEERPSDLIIIVGEMARTQPVLNRAFVTEFLRRIQEKSPSVRLAVGWVEARLAEDGLTVGQLVQGESQYQAAAQVSVGNSIGSLRFLDAMDWQDFVEAQSRVEQVLRTDPAGIYLRMDFATRDLYRHMLERIARHSRKTEFEVAELAIRLAEGNSSQPDDRLKHVGFFLTGKGVRVLENEAKVRIPLRNILPRIARQSPLAFYLGGILAVTLLVTYVLLRAASTDISGWWMPGLLGLLILFSTSQLSVSLVNWFLTLFVAPSPLPRLDFSEGIPAAHATLVVVPTMLTNADGIESILEALEVRYLANRDDQVFFALLTDFLDAPRELMAGDDDLLNHAREGIEALNRKYKSDRPCIFYLLQRPRRWNAQEKVWMGYERKRGKLTDLNSFLRGGNSAAFSQVIGDLALLPRIKYVITLDTDTQLPRDAARRLVATMAHPLNLPIYDTKKGLIVEGYSILQPRIAVSLPSAARSRYVKLFSGEPGIDPYTRMVSDVYQDVFHEGSFIGKGIYDVDAFERALGGRFPENRILSHDLLEGSYARAALVSDIQLFEEFPSRYTADARRRHRWMRGDWQIASWLLPRLPVLNAHRAPNPLTGLSRWKIFDNLRRSLIPFALLSLLLLGWLLFPQSQIVWGLVVLSLNALPSLLTGVSEFLHRSKDMPFHVHLENVTANFVRQMGQATLTMVFLPYDAVMSLDAVTRTLGRLIVTRRHLLEWQTSTDVQFQDNGGLRSFVSAMACAPALAVSAAMLFFLSGNASWIIWGNFALWFFSPVIAWWISLPIEERRSELSVEEAVELHTLCRKTWNFFETFVNDKDHWLPPDNFQEYPRPVIAHRTSPTNIGLTLLGTLAAHDFGYISMRGMTQRIARTLATTEKLERHRGHFYNWYDTLTLKPMSPLYISTVDNGNLSGMLLTLHSGLVELVDQNWNGGRIIAGLRDTLGILKEHSDNPDNTAKLEALGKLLDQNPDRPAEIVQLLEQAVERLRKMASAEPEIFNEFENWRKIMEESCHEQRGAVLASFPWAGWREPLTDHLKNEAAAELKRFWSALNQPMSTRLLAEGTRDRLARLDELILAAIIMPANMELTKILSELRQCVASGGQQALEMLNELNALAVRCDEMARMDFKLLYDPERELFSIGYNVSQHRLDGNCYDLLASEARLGSYVAIALGQVDQNHWFRLGRSLTSAGGKPALISWSGSMFEYLMPLLVMPNYERTLLDVSCKSAVARQIQYGKQTKVPWGISESGYNLRDAGANYQYRAFGVPGLGFKRGLAHDLVIAPYATVMALMVAPEESCKNLKALGRENAGGKFGLYEALDYTASRIPSGQTHAIIRSFMAHHQGMSLLSLNSILLDRPMQRRFQGNPLLKSAELLLHERVPRETTVRYPHELEASRTQEPASTGESVIRVITDPNIGPPEVHLLSNGRYHVMVSNTGGGYSRWNETAITRWREDAAHDCWGTFFYLRDVDSSAFWSPTHQPTLKAKTGYEAIFSQGRAEFRSLLQEIEMHTEIAVSPESDVEVRRLTLMNHSDRVHTLEVTTYAEIVLNTMAAELAHPAFSNLFVQTQILPQQNAIICSRRPRTAREKAPWMAQLLLIRGAEIGSVSFETDRGQFIGRGGNLISPAALRNAPPLSNTAGSVLDPIASIRRTIRIEPKESATMTLVCGIAPSREEILGIIEKYQDQTIADRCFELAWTHGLLMLRHLNTTEGEAQLYGRLAGALLYNQMARRAHPNVLARNQRGQRNLWSFGISGDLPILLLQVTHADRTDLMRQIVQAHAYWRLKGLAVDLVILNEDDSVYRGALHDQILNLVTANNASQLLDEPGGVFLRRADQFSPEDKILLEATARIVLRDDNGSLAEQLSRRPRLESLPPPLRLVARPENRTASNMPARELAFFNGLGGFTPDGREYVVILSPGATTPAPWANVLANPNFGTLITENGGGYTWSENAHEFRLTPWNNDAVTDSSGEAFYIRDELTGEFWSPTPLPARGNSSYVSRHGFGYSVFEHTRAGVASELRVYVAMNEPVKIAMLKIKNGSNRVKRLGLTGYWEWVLGELRTKNAMYIVTENDRSTGALFARNAYNSDFEGRIAFVTSSEPDRSCTADRLEFLGRNGTLAQPAALGRTRLSGKTGAGLDPCAALQVQVELEPGQEREIAFILGAGQNQRTAQDLARRFQNLQTCREELDKVREFWKQTLEMVQVQTPEPALNFLANGWLLYQTISCRLWARTGFYQSGGAFGFRDQLQDAMTLVHTRRELLREQLLRAAAHQFREGDVLHWWHPPTGRGVRTHFSDDFLWLPYATCRYVEAVGDTGVLDSEVPFLEGRALRPEEEANYDVPQNSAESGTLYEHCVRAVKNGLKFGEHGLPLMGCGDWNDGMNLIGEKGKGESVWLAFFLYDVLQKFSNLAARHGDDAFAKHCEEQAKTLREKIEQNAWDGKWYRRAYFDDGKSLGSASDPECQIDSLPQSWSVISGAGSQERVREALDSVAERLVRRDAKIIQLFDPPFDQSHLEPGYIKGYVPGVRENGGQYTHAAVWTVMAFSLAGETNRAWEYFRLINPILQASDPNSVARYKTEPYVVAADVYSVPPHTGRGGWTWYTGSAGWMYRLILETLLGVEVAVKELRFTPRVPKEWKSFQVDYRYRETVFHIACINESGSWKPPGRIQLDGIAQAGPELKLKDDRREHTAVVRF